MGLFLSKHIMSEYMFKPKVGGEEGEMQMRISDVGFDSLLAQQSLLAGKGAVRMFLDKDNWPDDVRLYFAGPVTLRVGGTVMSGAHVPAGEVGIGDQVFDMFITPPHEFKDRALLACCMLASGASGAWGAWGRGSLEII